MTEAAGAVVTPTAVSANEPPYESEPSKVATMVYSPAVCGVHIFLNMPPMSVVTVPKFSTPPLESMAVKST